MPAAGHVEPTRCRMRPEVISKRVLPSTRDVLTSFRFGWKGASRALTSKYSWLLPQRSGATLEQGFDHAEAVLFHAHAMSNTI